MIHSLGLGQDEQKEGESYGKIIPAADSSRTTTTATTTVTTTTTTTTTAAAAVVHNNDDDHDGDGHGDGHGHANDREDVNVGSSREKKALDSKLRRLQQAIATFEKQKKSQLGKAQT